MGAGRQGKSVWIECCRPVGSNVGSILTADESIGFKTPSNNIYCSADRSSARTCCGEAAVDGAALGGTPCRCPACGGQRDRRITGPDLLTSASKILTFCVLGGSTERPL